MDTIIGKSIDWAKRNMDTIEEDVLNSKVIVTEYFHQYASGIGGSNTKAHVYVKEDGMGWPYDAAAYKAAKDAGIKPYSRKGKDEGYGEVGAKQLTRKVMTLREAIEYEPGGSLGYTYGYTDIEALTDTLRS